MTPLPTISTDPHPCDLCGETIPSGVYHATTRVYFSEDGAHWIAETAQHNLMAWGDTPNEARESLYEIVEEALADDLASGFDSAIRPNAPDYHAHAACQEIADVIGSPFRVTLAALSPSDLCEILRAHSADEIVRVVNLRANLTETTP